MDDHRSNVDPNVYNKTTEEVTERPLVIARGDDIDESFLYIAFLRQQKETARFESKLLINFINSDNKMAS